MVSCIDHLARHSRQTLCQRQISLVLRFQPDCIELASCIGNGNPEDLDTRNFFQLLNDLPIRIVSDQFVLMQVDVLDLFRLWPFFPLRSLCRVRCAAFCFKDKRCFRRNTAAFFKNTFRPQRCVCFYGSLCCAFHCDMEIQLSVFPRNCGNPGFDFTSFSLCGSGLSVFCDACRIF